jgi:hypothetical protein
MLRPEGAAVKKQTQKGRYAVAEEPWCAEHEGKERQ